MERRIAGASRLGGRTDTGIGGEPTAFEFRAFVRLAENLHFGRTAAALGLAQSSLSEAIRRLEANLDVVLFERTSRTVALTDAGARALPAAREVLGGLAAVRAAVAGGSVPDVGSLQLGIEGQGFAELNRPIIAAFREEHPQMPLVLREVAGTPQAFFEGRFDVALMRSPIDDDRLRVHAVATEPRGVVVAATHPAADCGEASILDFLDDPFVALAPHVATTRDYWLELEPRGGEPARIGGEAFNVQETAYAIGDLELVTTGCASFVRSLPLAGTVFISTDDLAPNTLGVVTRANDARPAVLAFIDLVRGVIRALDGAAPGITPLPLPDPAPPPADGGDRSARPDRWA